MSTTIKTTHLTITLFFFLLINVRAQDKYEFAVLSFKPSTAELILCENGTIYKAIEVAKEEIKNSHFDTNPALKQITKMQTENWELFNTGTTISSGSPAYIYYLRKKIGN